MANPLETLIHTAIDRAAHPHTGSVVELGGDRYQWSVNYPGGNRVTEIVRSTHPLSDSQKINLLKEQIAHFRKHAPNPITPKK